VEIQLFQVLYKWMETELEKAEFPLLGILKDIILDDECKICFVKKTSVTSSTGQQTQHVGSVGYNGGIPTMNIFVVIAFFI
jgi:hypothetical protein